MAGARPKLSRREREVMDVLYRRGEATAGGVLGELADPPTYSAVRSILRILKTKGHVTHRADGARYVYAPAVAQERARRAAVDHLVDTFFSGSPARAMAALLGRDDLDLSEAQVRRLTREIRQAEKEGR